MSALGQKKPPVNHLHRYLFIYLHKYQSFSEATHLKCTLIDNVHVFQVSTVNPGAYREPHSDIVSPPVHGCECCDCSIALGRCLLWSHEESNLFFKPFLFNANWHGVISKINEMHWEVFVLLVWKVLTLASLNNGCITSNANFSHLFFYKIPQI